MNPLLIFGVLIVGIILLILLTKNKKLLFWIPFIAVFLPIGFIDRFFYSVPSLVKWLPQFLFVGFAGLSLLLNRKQKVIMPSSLLWIYFLLLLISVFSMTYNETPLIQLVLAQRPFIYIIAALILLKSAYSKFTLDDIYTYMVKMGLIMAGIALFQRIVFVMLLRLESGDIITGLFSVDGEYLFYQVVCIIIVFAYWIQGKKLLKMSPGNTLLILIGSIAIANNKAGILFVMAVVAFFAFQTGFNLFWRHSKKLIYIASFIVIGILAFDYIYKSFYGYHNKSASVALSDPEYIRQYFFGDDTYESKFAKEGALRRGASIEFAFSLINTDVLSLMLGKGPGSVSEAAGREGYISEKYPGYTIGRTTISLFLSEYGLGGLMCYVLFLAAIYFWKPKSFQFRKEHSYIRKTVVFFMILYAPYQTALLTLSYAFIAGIIIYPNLEKYFKKHQVAPEEMESQLETNDVLIHQASE